jgi:hypothetical protein
MNRAKTEPDRPAPPGRYGRDGLTADEREARRRLARRGLWRDADLDGDDPDDLADLSAGPAPKNGGGK